MYKFCKRCHTEKQLTEFYKDKSRKGGFGFYCKICSGKNVKQAVEKNREKYNETNRKYCQKNRISIRKASKRWRDKNKKLLKQKRKKHYEENREKVLAAGKKWRESNKEYNRERVRKWRKSNKEKIRKREYDRYHNDINFRLSCILRRRLRDALKFQMKNGSAVKDLGCSIEELKFYIQSKFQPGMSWDNYGPEKWHIDHIKSLASFDLTNRKELLEACHYTNLQPLWAEDKWRKNKYDISNFMCVE